MKKSKILALIPQNLVIYNTKNLCHHIEHTLFYLWFKYGASWKNIVSHVESFSIKLCSVTQFLSHLSGHLRTCFNHPNHKKSSPFESKHMWISNEKKISQIFFFINVVVIQSSVFIVILGWDSPFGYLNYECTQE
jgi:hypothetical protein